MSSAASELINTANVVPGLKQPLAILLVGLLWRYQRWQGSNWRREIGKWRLCICGDRH